MIFELHLPQIASIVDHIFVEGGGGGVNCHVKVLSFERNVQTLAIAPNYLFECLLVDFTRCREYYVKYLQAWARLSVWDCVSIHFWPQCEMFATQPLSLTLSCINRVLSNRSKSSTVARPSHWHECGLASNAFDNCGLRSSTKTYHNSASRLLERATITQFILFSCLGSSLAVTLSSLSRVDLSGLTFRRARLLLSILLFRNTWQKSEKRKG